MLRNNKFLNSILILATGSIIAQVINVASSPIITRLFSPENIGIYTYILTISQMFGPVINGRYNLSIVYDRNEKNVYSLIHLSFVLGILMTILISIGLTFYFYLNSTLIGYNIFIIFTLIFLLFISYSLINILSSYNNRYREYKTLSKVPVIRSIMQNGGAITAAFLHTGMLSLLIPYVIGQYCGIKLQYETLAKNKKKLLNFNFKRMKIVALKHINQLKYSTPAIFANSFSYSSLIIFVEILYGFTSVGFYAITARLLGLPLNIISSNVSKVYFESASKEYNNTNKFVLTFNKTFLFLTVIAIPMLLVLVLFSPSLFALILGNEWYVAGIYASILAPMFTIRFIVSAISPSMIIAKKQRYELILQLLFILCAFVSFIVSLLFGFKIRVFLSYISVSYSMVYLLYFIKIYQFSRGKNNL